MRVVGEARGADGSAVDGARLEQLVGAVCAAASLRVWRPLSAGQQGWVNTRLWPSAEGGAALAAYGVAAATDEDIVKGRALWMRQRFTHLRHGVPPPTGAPLPTVADEWVIYQPINGPCGVLAGARHARSAACAAA